MEVTNALVEQELQNERFFEWIEQHDAMLRKVARVYAPSGEHDALHQDLLIAVWHAVPLYRGDAKVSTFLYRVALNCAMNWTRRERGYRSRHVGLQEEPVDPRRAGSSQGLASEQSERVERLYTAMDGLSPADRSLALLYLDGRSYREMADVLGITENNAGVRLNRVKKRLSDRLRVAERAGKEKAK